jgi:hypothetical protein
VKNNKERELQRNNIWRKIFRVAVLSVLLIFKLVLLTVRLVVLAHSGCMKPNFQGLLWFAFDELDEDELFLLN